MEDSIAKNGSISQGGEYLDSEKTKVECLAIKNKTCLAGKPSAEACATCVKGLLSTAEALDGEYVSLTNTYRSGRGLDRGVRSKEELLESCYEIGCILNEKENGG